LKVPIFAMSLLLGCSSPRPSRPRWRSAGRKRSTTHPLRAGAQRRMAAARLSCLARNGRTGVPARLRAGWQAKGKKVSPPPLRHRRSRRSRRLARSSHWRPCGSPGPTATPGEHVADIERSAQEVAFIGRRKRNPCVEMGGSLVAVQNGETARPHHGWYRVNRGRGLARREGLH
jgi:hypothetical protein